MSSHPAAPAPPSAPRHGESRATRPNDRDGLPTGPRFVRSQSERLVTGVAGGLAERWNVDPYALRLAIIVLSLAGGIGVVIYGLAWLSSIPAPLSQGPTRPPVGPTSSEPTDPALRTQRTFAIGLATLGILLLLRGRWFWPGDAIMVPGTIVAIASALLWYRSAPSSSARDPLEQVVAGSASPIRTGIGGVLALAGVAVMASSAGGLGDLPRSAAAMVVALAGVAVLVGPYVGRLISQVGDEQRTRIRTEERAAVASHLHDSVLQTLALMQRSADDPRRMVALARRQERELRSWLYGTGTQQADASLVQRCESIASEIELDVGVSVELVVVGDAGADTLVDALLGAVREATLNAARHAGVDRVSVYVEVEERQLFASVRDTGCGFEPMSVPPDRRGVVDSIRGRLARVGGTAELRTSPESGTEWELRVPVESRMRPIFEPSLFDPPSPTESWTANQPWEVRPPFSSPPTPPPPGPLPAPGVGGSASAGEHRPTVSDQP